MYLYPCEVAVNNPLLYKSWGEKQMYIIAFHNPLYLSPGNEVNGSFASLMNSIVGIMTSILGLSSASARSFPRLLQHEKEIDANYCFPPVEDMTHQYTSDEAHGIEEP